ncbi:hypothetical protein [Bacillus sp. RIT 809]|uniref:hypothetical protein n=1 Tax=Bacillus sp. RIT 809 TaxID=2803857 RepID=UPI00194F3284|nr:hypothetical protein [Bacillus sp. RIT 809]MBM6649045.1 hypothetical protein [Bacillus sp. RIT 809]
MARVYNEVITDEQYLIANKNGISKKNVYQRVNEYGWSIEKAITKPIYNTNKRKTERALMLLAELNGVNYATYRQRIKDGMDPHEAAVKRTTISVELQIALDNGIEVETFRGRVKRGMTPYEAATQPLKIRKFSTEYKKELKIAKSNGITYQKFYNRVMNLGFDPMEAATKKTTERISNAAIAIKNGISENTYYQRVHKGWSKEDAMTIPVVKSKRYFDCEQKANLHRSTTA